MCVYAYIYIWIFHLFSIKWQIMLFLFFPLVNQVLNPEFATQPF